MLCEQTLNNRIHMSVMIAKCDMVKLFSISKMQWIQTFVIALQDVTVHYCNSYPSDLSGRVSTI